jgi:hypothetical protein
MKRKNEQVENLSRVLLEPSMGPFLWSNKPKGNGKCHRCGIHGHFARDFIELHSTQKKSCDKLIW